MKKFILILILLAMGIAVLIYCRYNREKETPYVVMLSMDGFRWDYPDHVNTPNLDRIRDMGVKAYSLQASFPTKTFPNHYTMATGLYPDHHGLVHNNYYDPELDIFYSTRDREAVGNGKLYGGEPIWNTAEKQGIKAASLFWIGSEADINGMRQSTWNKYQHNLPYEQRIDSVIHWLSLPEEKRPHLITWYFDEPDSKGHKYGPGSEEVDQTIMYLDSLVGVFLQRLEELPIYEHINIIITSDHGMGPVAEERTIFLDDWLKKEWTFTIRGSSPVYNIKANEGCLDSIYNALKPVEHLSVWKPEEIPEKLNYGTNPRELDITVLADSAWSVEKIKENRSYSSAGAHGYDNYNTDMHAIFYAAGPAFKKKHSHPTFENVDIYLLIAKILDLKPAKTDGDIKRVEDMLQ